MTLAPICPFAVWRPLGNVTDEPGISRRLFIVHTMVGGLMGTDSYFRSGNGAGYAGAESTFGIGGPTDGSRDGTIFQWQRTDREADAQYDANPYATSVETSDGGHPSNPWSAKQLDALVRLGTWWAQGTGFPVQLAKSPDGVGFGYHAQFNEWNRSGHVCPGNVRLHQYTSIVLPRIRAAVDGPTPKPIPAPKPIPKPVPTPPPGPHIPAFPFGSGDYLGKPSSNAHCHSGFYSATDAHAVMTWQKQMRARGWNIPMNGHYDDATESVCRKFQAEKHLGVDGYVGPATWKAAWTAAVTS